MASQTKFRWTENLTCRFIQLRKENGKLFTGRKYSAQAGWEYILQQMREEFPVIMGDVHYRVLKKKWSNLLQQYKELKNPVHGDRNKADDVSWPFYNAIDQVLGHSVDPSGSNEVYIDPQEFLCVSVTPEEPTTFSSDAFPSDLNPEEECKKRILPDTIHQDYSRHIRKVIRETAGRQASKTVRRKRDSRGRLPPLNDLPIEEDGSKEQRVTEQTVSSPGNKGQSSITRNEDEERPRKLRRRRLRGGSCREEDHESRIDRRIEEIFQYAKQRDEENRSIMVRIMHTVETIANKL